MKNPNDHLWHSELPARTDSNCPLHGDFDYAPTGTCSCPPKVTYVDVPSASSCALKPTSDECELKPTGPDVTIYMDQKPFSVLAQYKRFGLTELPSMPTLSGAQILALVGRDGCSQLFLENPDQHKADMLIPVWNAVVLTDGMQFYAIPPTTGA